MHRGTSNLKSLSTAAGCLPLRGKPQRQPVRGLACTGTALIATKFLTAPIRRDAPRGDFDLAQRRSPRTLGGT